jgi:hypothetical protein
LRGVPPAIDDLNGCTIDACDPVAGVSHTPAESGRSCFVDGVCNAFGACDAAGTCQPTSAVRDVRVYDDALNACFENCWESTRFDPNHQALVYSGARAIRIEPISGERVGFWAGELEASFDAVEFWVHGGTTGGQALSFYAYDGVSGLYYGSLALDVLGHPLVPGIWEYVRIPFSAPSSPGYLEFGLVSDETGEAFYLDDVRLVRDSP